MTESESFKFKSRCLNAEVTMPLKYLSWRACEMPLTLFRMGLFGVAHGLGAAHTYPTTMKIGTVISYLNKNPKIYKSRYTAIEFC